jgi:hypothetical protein
VFSTRTCSCCRSVGGYPKTVVRRPSEAVSVVDLAAPDGLGGPSYKEAWVFA